MYAVLALFSYSFAYAYEYCQYFEALKNIDKLFLSDIIKRMILDGIEFKPCEVKDYIDWGTKEDWFEYVRKYKTLFIDLDGTLVKSSGKHTPPYWGETEAIKASVFTLFELRITPSQSNTIELYFLRFIIYFLTSVPSRPIEYHLQYQRHSYHFLLQTFLHDNLIQRTLISQYPLIFLSRF